MRKHLLLSRVKTRLYIIMSVRCSTLESVVMFSCLLLIEDYNLSFFFIDDLINFAAECDVVLRILFNIWKLEKSSTFTL